MSILKNTERIDLEIFGPSNDGEVVMDVFSTILLGRKGKNENKLDPIYLNTYDSNKYSNRDSLNTIRTQISSFIVFKYTDYSDKDEIITEEIFFSYPRIDYLIGFIEDIYDMIFGDLSKKIYTKKNSINADYKDYKISTNPNYDPDNDDLNGGKKKKRKNSKNKSTGEKHLIAFPNIIEDDESGICSKGVTIIFNNYDYYVTLTEKAIITLCNVLMNLDLMTLSNQTLIVGMLSLMGSNPADGESTHSPLKRRPIKNVPSRRKNSSFKNRNNDDEEEDETEVEIDEEDVELDFSRRRRNKKQDDEEVVEYDEDEDDEEDEKEIEPPKKKNKKSTTTKKKKTNKKKKQEDEEDEEDEEENTSYKELMEAAEEIEYEDDEEIEFDD